MVGKITNATYDFGKKAYILSGEIYDKQLALKIKNNLIKYVSLRINPQDIEIKDNIKYARNLIFEELSFVRAPGDPNAKILNWWGNRMDVTTKNIIANIKQELAKLKSVEDDKVKSFYEQVTEQITGLTEEAPKEETKEEAPVASEKSEEKADKE